MRFPSSLLPGLPRQGHTVRARPVSFTKPSAEAPTRTCGATVPQPQVSFFTQKQTTESCTAGPDAASAQPALLVELQTFCWTWLAIQSRLQAPPPPSRPRAASPAGPSVPGVTALPAQGQSQFGWAGDQERAYAMLKAWMGLSMLKPHSFLTVLHGLLSLVFTPGACQAPLAWMQVHPSTEK